MLMAFNLAVVLLPLMSWLSACRKSTESLSIAAYHHISVFSKSHLNNTSGDLYMWIMIDIQDSGKCVAIRTCKCSRNK